ncbi:alpha/beta fold hydrolase [Aggregicoccus sp. 17bor-14]|uniref:alpha/beta fold hydrolase n=1 Tax=Myxococcaceae TaxID=31 RepID=UPI00129D216D|nr:MULTISPECIES: alpha/beta fold hydrolase [Myxococcaceae]MBF5041682.1 alpha/beta fold hydrolase [Simulacricoccus sp. 17bor-14]MRI87464.1 alpha/beta fold hydrolase [Aggregicoccus sp. 17bor-14]
MSAFRAADAPRLFDLRLPALPLSRGGTVEPHHARGWWWGPEQDLPVLAARTRSLSAAALRLSESQGVVRRPEPLPPPRPLDAMGSGLDPRVPTVLLVHALTGDARAGGEGGWWAPLIGPGRPLDPSRVRLLCFNNLGSCYGSSGPLDPGFPAQAEVTPWDQARAHLQALDALGVGPLALVAGGSLGGMVSLALGALSPSRVRRLLPVATSATASAWVVGFNHVAREVLRLDPGYPDRIERGLELARQLAMLTYRAESGLEQRQGRHLPPEPTSTPGAPRIQGYLEHQGLKLSLRFDARAYLQQLGAMDAHDLFQPPPGKHGAPALARIRASSLVVEVDSDQLFTPAQSAALAGALEAAGTHVERARLASPHGHDAFLIEWEQLAPLVTRALALPEPLR